VSIDSTRQKQHYEAIHTNYEDHYYDAQSMAYRERFYYDPLFEGLDLNGCRVADLASGSGHNSVALLKRFPKAVVTGFDISSSACKAYRHNVGRPGIEADLTKPLDHPDKFDADDDSQREFRQRFIPSGLANEIFLDVYERLASFERGVTDFKQRLFDAYAAEVARVDTNNDGVISAAEGDVDTASDGFPDNARLFIPATRFNRFAVTREINDGLLAPRFTGGFSRPMRRPAVQQ